MQPQGAPWERASAENWYTETAMKGQPLEQKVIITNPRGFHLRPMSAFVQQASRFQSTVTLVWGEKTANGKSIFELMALAAPQGSEFQIKVDGPDALDALDALVAVLQTVPVDPD